MTFARRILSALLTIWLAATLAFFMLRILPGDAIEAQLVRGGGSQAAVAQARARLGLDDPVIVQYARFIGGLLRGDLGVSLVTRQPVSQMIVARLLPTIVLALSAVICSTILGVALGTLGAFDAAPSRVARALTGVAISTPIYWTGTLAIVIFAAQLNWLPSSGTGTLQHLIMPVAVLSFHGMGEIARVTQVNVRDVRSAPYVQVAHSRGLPPYHIIQRYVLRVGLVPVVTVIALQAGFLLSGVVITETLFLRPGLGRLLLRHTLLQDYPVVQGIVILSATGYTLLSILAAIIHGVVDPRIRD